ncbi:DUF6567 family protein [Fibrobacterota bacterium]
MNKKKLLFAIVIVIAILFSGCSTSGMFLSSNRTNVELSQANYQVTATNVSGNSKSGYILGVSASIGSKAGALALFRVSGSGKLYQDALADLWKNYEEKHGSVEGRKLALVNVRYDADMLNLLLYTQVKLSVRADVVEFGS